MQKRIIIKIIFCLILFISAIAAIIIKLNSDKPKVGKIGRASCRERV